MTKKTTGRESTRAKNAIVFVIDGLHTGFVGAYGNSGAVTPALDRLACDSLLCDRYYTDTLDLSLLYREFWFGITANEPETDTMPDFANLPKRLEEKGYRTMLLTDDTEIAYNLYADGFSEVHRVESPQLAQPVDSLEETRFFKMFASVVDLVEESDKPYFLWCHFKGFAGYWDFPMEYRNEFMEEGDPEPYCGTSVPRIDARCQEDEIDPDEQQSAVEAYSGGVAVLDEAFCGLMESLGENTLLVFTASRGFSMGEHRLIGMPEVNDLWGENLHLPLFVRLPQQQDYQRMSRSTSLAQPCDIHATLAEWFGFYEGKSLLQLFDDETASFRNEIQITGDRAISAVMQGDWFFRIRIETDEFQEKRQRIDLFAKPDDRYEVNEVADRCDEIVEAFLEREKLQTQDKPCPN